MLWVIDHSGLVHSMSKGSRALYDLAVLVGKMAVRTDCGRICKIRSGRNSAWVLDEIPDGPEINHCEGCVRVRETEAQEGKPCEP